MYDACQALRRWELPSKDPMEPFFRITVEEAREMVQRPEVAVIDVRTPAEYESGHVPGAILLPVDSLYGRTDELPRNKELLMVCGVGQRSALACEIAASAGLEQIYNLEGGTMEWIEKGNPIER